MTSRSYSRIVNVLIAVGVISAFLHDRVGDFAWLTLVVTALSAVTAMVVYFRFHWSRRADDAPVAEDGCIEEHDRAENETGAHRDPAQGVVVEPHRAVVAVGSEVVADGNWFAPRPFDHQNLGLFLAEMAKHKWEYSGTIRLQPPSRDFVLNVIVKDGTVRFVPSYGGGHSPPRQKQPLSQPTPQPPTLRLATGNR